MMMYFNLIVMFLIMMGGVWVFCSNRKHLLATLLSLEFIVLSLFMMLVSYLGMFDQCTLYFSVVFLTYVVCEGALGLSILVSMIRTHGNDFFQAFSILQC